VDLHGGFAADRLRFLHEARGQLEGFGSEGVLVSQLDIAEVAVVVRVLLQQFAEFLGLCGGNVTIDCQTVFVGQLLNSGVAIVANHLIRPP
jgi:hypothetical protein